MTRSNSLLVQSILITVFTFGIIPTSMAKGDLITAYWVDVNSSTSTTINVSQHMLLKALKKQDAGW